MISKIAFQDGVLSPLEVACIADIADELSIPLPDDLTILSQAHSISDLLRHVRSYEDRFFIAARAWMVALADEELTHNERVAIDDMMRRLGIRASDKAIIQKIQPGMTTTELRFLDDRIEHLYVRSSFYMR